MPPAVRYLSPNDIQRNGITGLLVASDTRRRSDWFTTIWAYYHGNHPAQLEKSDGEPDDNVTINMIKKVVDRTVAFLFPALPSLELDAEVTTETPDEKWMRETWQANDGLALLHDMALSGCMMGDVYVRVFPPDPDETHPYPLIVPINPSSVQTYWDANNIRKVMWHEVTWSITDELKTIDYLIDFVKDGRRWVIKHYKMETGSSWEQDGEDEIWSTPLPPIIHTKHLPNPNSYYGMGEFTPAQIDLNNKINLVNGEVNRIIRYHASPKTIATGAEAGDIETTAVDALFAVPNSEAKIYNLEMKSDLSSSKDHADKLEETFLAESRVIILKGSVKDFQRVTNAGVRTVFIDQLLKNMVLQWNYGRLIQTISRVAAYVARKDDIVPDVVFAEALPIDDTEKINTAALEQQIGIVSRQTLSNKRGYSWPNELAKMKEEDELKLFNPPEPEKPGDGTDQPINRARRLQNEPGSTTNK